jgi:galactofuranosylgalactofuranosylrhamnosyl-N-acetylglucosaminyl-diphospho-decaprenol beta-1,5/1,6-galactofuranosyltransferase
LAFFTNHTMQALTEQQIRPLQHFIFPSSQLGLPETLYWKQRLHAAADQSKRILQLAERGYLDLESFFNSFSLLDWVHYCGISDIMLTIEGSGSVIVDVHQVHADGSASLVASRALQLEDAPSHHLALEIICGQEADSSRDLRYIFATLYAPTGATITQMSYGTTMAPRRHVVLGGVITHFRREHLVTAALRRLDRTLRRDRAFADAFSLVVVDNSQTLPEASYHDNIEILPNGNYGGAGGFTRGLLHFAQRDACTHVLFMDDDATLELGSIKRAIAYLAYEKDAAAAISGTLFIHPHKTTVYESGARMKNGVIETFGRGADVAHRHGLLAFGLQNETPDYGGWWFFAFPLARVEFYPFPYFVRGDDAAFGSSNKFAVRCPLGVACWGDSFEEKDSPLIRYLDMRHSLRHALLFDSGVFAKVVDLYSKWVEDLIGGFRYSSAAACLLAMHHAFKPAEFWRENLDLSKVRAEIKELLEEEKLSKATAKNHPALRLLQSQGLDVTKLQHHCRPSFKGNWLRFIVRKLTMNGLLLPRLFCPKAPVVLRRAGATPPRLIFPYKSVVYVSDSSGHVFVADQNIRRAFKLRFQLASMKRALKSDEATLKASAKQSFALLAARNFWQDIYSAKDNQ